MVGYFFMYNFQSNKKATTSSGRKFLLVFVALSLAVVAGNYFSNGAIARVVRVPAAAAWSTSGIFADTLGNLQHYFAEKRALERERDELEARVRELELYALNNMVLASENEDLRRLLGSEGERLSRGILARVLSRGGAFPFGSMIISRESDVEFATGSRVYGEQNFLLGTIAQVSPNNATVRLTSASGEETEVFIGAQDRVVQATVSGIGHGNLVAELARDADVRVGDPVVLFAENTSLVGFVGNIETKPSSAFQIVRVRTPVNLETVRFVRVR